MKLENLIDLPVITENSNAASITDYEVSFVKDQIKVKVKSQSWKYARNALHRLASAAYRYTQGKPVMFPGTVGRDVAKTVQSYFDLAVIKDIAVNNEGYSEYKSTVSDPDDYFNDFHFSNFI